MGNFLAVCFSFMINDIEDAPDDSLNPDKINRNPISAGRLSRKRALVATYIVAVISLLFYAQLGLLPFVFGLITLLLGWLYSWKPVRLKNIPIIDVLSHCLMLGGLLFLTAYFTFVPYEGIKLTWLLPFLFISSFSAYGELSNELRDYTYDLKAGLKHTAVFLGKKRAAQLMYTFLCFGIGTFVLSVLFGILPIWFIVTTVLLCMVFSLPFLLHQSIEGTTSGKTHIEESILQASTITLFLWVVVKAITQ